jgi:heme exporter protein C
MFQFANPTRFFSLADRVQPWIAVLSLLLIVTGLYEGLFIAPPDYQQGDAVRIMYVHVPFAWLSMACYSVMTLAAIGLLVFRHPLADLAHEAATPMGAIFTALALLTGAIWGKPMWGTWWVWDARLTSVLVLFVMYLGLMALRQAFDEPSRGAKAVAVLTLIGVINIPIIKFSVEWWNTLHQGASVFRLDGPTIHMDLLRPLLVSALGFTLLFIALHLYAMKNVMLRRRLEGLKKREAFKSEGPMFKEGA